MSRDVQQAHSFTWLPRLFIFSSRLLNQSASCAVEACYYYRISVLLLDVSRWHAGEMRGRNEGLESGMSRESLFVCVCRAQGLVCGVQVQAAHHGSVLCVRDGVGEAVLNLYGSGGVRRKET